MSIRIIKWSNVLEHCKGDRIMLNAFEDFRRRLKFSQESKNPHDLISTFQNSDLITCPKTKQSRIVFNIGNNKYRLICGYLFRPKQCILFIKFLGTHKEYNKVDVCTINMFK